MRGGIAGQTSPHPLADTLPAVYAEDGMAQRFTAGLDDLLAPLMTALDCAEAYFSASLAPLDFVAWLADWVGAEVRPDDAQQQLRQAVATAAVLHRSRGTSRGLAAAVQLAFGVAPEIVESGGACWAAAPLGPFPGDPVPRLEVTLRVSDPEQVDAQRLRELVATARPAHMPFTVNVVGDRSAS